MLCKHNVVGSIPSTSTKFRTLAQLVERLPYTQNVVSSNLASPTILWLASVTVAQWPPNPLDGVQFPGGSPEQTIVRWQSGQMQEPAKL